MRTFLLFLLITMSAAARAEYYYIWLTDFRVTDNQYPQYSSPDAACHAAYDYDTQVRFPALGATKPLPYKDPVAQPVTSPKFLDYLCQTQSMNPESGSTTTVNETIRRLGNDCTSAQTYNPQTDKCEEPDQEADRKELGDPSNPLVAGMIACGDPVNVATGNVFESEMDYQDADGELRYGRSYNSQAGYWNFSYQTRMYVDGDPLTASNNVRVIQMEDGRSILFTLDNGIATPEASELGSLTQVNGLWTYSSPTNEQFTFDDKGRLIRWRQANGLVQTLTYTQIDYVTTKTTVTDSRGHTLEITSSYGQPNTAIAGELTLTYQFDSARKLSKVTRTWPGHSTSRTYLYEDTAHPRMLTGIIDERGIRSATWAYDAQGRAISNQRAIGADKVTFAYNADGSTTITNALGNSTTFNYQIVQGVKRMVSVAGQPAAGCPASNSSFTYTANGQLATKTDALGTVTAYTYDTAGREISRVEAKGTPEERTITTTWDATRFLPLTVTTADRVTTYTYDDQGRVLTTSIHATKE